MLFEPWNMFAKDRADFLMLSSVSLSGFSQEQIRYRKLGKLKKKEKPMGQASSTDKSLLHTDYTSEFK